MILICIVIVCLLAIYGRSRKSSSSVVTAPSHVADTTAVTFSLPEIPSDCTDVEQRIGYLSLRYWDETDFTNPGYIDNPDVTEQAYVDFLDLLSRLPSSSRAAVAYVRMLQHASASPRMLEYMAALSEKYLYEPNSPFRNEELYTEALHFILVSEKVDSLGKLRPAYQLEMLSKNAPGSVATDFRYMLPDGRKRRLWDVKAEHTIVFFNDPDCGTCKDYKMRIATSPVFLQLHSATTNGRRRLAILAVCLDAELPRWREASYPDIMINGYDADREISEGELYDLRAIPSLYLLDRNKRVILRNVTPEVIEEYLKSEKP